MATQTVEREMVAEIVQQYQEAKGQSIAVESVAPPAERSAAVTLTESNALIAARTVEQPKERRVGFLRGVADALWRASSGFSLSGLFLPVESVSRRSNALPKEKAWREAELMGLDHF